MLNNKGIPNGSTAKNGQKLTGTPLFESIIYNFLYCKLKLSNDYSDMEVKCNTKDCLKLSELTEFQGGLKERDDKDYAKIEKSIKQYGFAFPFFVWNHDGVNHVLDDHGRFGALSRMVAVLFDYWGFSNEESGIKNVMWWQFSPTLTVFI